MKYLGTLSVRSFEPLVEGGDLVQREVFGFKVAILNLDGPNANRQTAFHEMMGMLPAHMQDACVVFFDVQPYELESALPAVDHLSKLLWRAAHLPDGPQREHVTAFMAGYMDETQAGK